MDFLKWITRGGVLLGAFVSWAQNIQFRAEVDRSEISISESLTLRFILESESEPLQADFQFLAEGFRKMGRNESFSERSTYDSSQGHFSRKRTRTVQYFLEPLKTGVFFLKDLKAQIGSQVLKAPDLQISVVQDPSPHAQARPRKREIRGEDFLEVRLEFPEGRDSFFKGERLRVSYVLYFQVDRLNRIQSEHYPQFSGFFKEELYNYFLNPRSAEVEETTCTGGQACRKLLLAEYALSPLREGVLEIDPMGVRLEYTSRNHPNPFEEDSFFSSFFQSLSPKEKSLKSRSRKITIASLPESGKPSSFSGGVGQFKLNANLSSNRTEVDQPVTLLLEIEGDGSALSSLSWPPPKLPGKIDLYDSQGKMTSSPSSQKAKRILEYVLIPRAPGEFLIPSLEISFFDPQKKSYYTLHTGSLPLNVQGEMRHEETPPRDTSPSSPEIPRDFRLQLKPLKAPLPVSSWGLGLPPLWRVFYVLFSLGGILLVLFWGISSIRKMLKKKVFSLGNSDSKKALKAWFEASVSLQSMTQGLKIYEEGATRVGHFLEERIGESIQGKTRSELEQMALNQGRLTPFEWAALQSVLEEYDRVRFSEPHALEWEQNRLESIRADGLKKLFSI